MNVDKMDGLTFIDVKQLEKTSYKEINGVDSTNCKPSKKIDGGFF